MDGRFQGGDSSLGPWLESSQLHVVLACGRYEVPPLQARGPGVGRFGGPLVGTSMHAEAHTTVQVHLQIGLLDKYPNNIQESHQAVSGSSQCRNVVNGKKM